MWENSQGNVITAASRLTAGSRAPARIDHPLFHAALLWTARCCEQEGEGLNPLPAAKPRIEARGARFLRLFREARNVRGATSNDGPRQERCLIGAPHTIDILSSTLDASSEL
jgi:hypothetical protein